MACNRNFDACGGIGLVVSVAFGALVAILFNLGFIPFIVTAVWIVFGLAVLALVVLIWGAYLAASSPSSVLRVCINRNGLCLLAGAIGTIVASIIALAIPLVTTSILITIFIAVLAFFFALTLIALIALLRCIIVHLVRGGDQA